MKLIVLPVIVSVMSIIAVGGLSHMLYGVDSLAAFIVMCWLIIVDLIMSVLTGYLIYLIWKIK